MLAFAAQANGPIYYWVDKYGNLHATDRIESVPAVYRASYKEEAKQPHRNRMVTEVVYISPRKKEIKQDSLELKTDNLPGKIPDDLAKLSSLRSQLRNTKKELDEVNAELGRLRYNPILRETPAVKDQISAAKNRQNALLEEVQLLEKEMKLSKAEKERAVK